MRFDSVKVTTSRARVQERARNERKRRSRQTSTWERVAIAVVAAGAGLVAGFAPGSVTGWVVSDVLARAVAAALVAMAGSYARRWSWLVLAGLAALGSEEGVWLGVAAAGLFVALAASLLNRRRLYGSVAVGLAVQPLFHLPDLGFRGASTLFALAAVGPVLISAYVVSPRRIRRRVHRVLLISGAVALAGGLLLGVAALLAYGSASAGASRARDGIAHVRDGDSAGATRSFERAAESFRDAEGVFGGIWLKPVFVLPVIGKHAEGVSVLAEEGEQLASALARSTAIVDYERLKYRDGGIDLSAVRNARDPLAEAAGAFGKADERLSELRGDLLLQPLAGMVDEFGAKVAEGRRDVEIAAAAAAVGPSLFGGEGERRYLVLFTQPAEMRGLGGFVAAWAMLSAQDGRVQVVDSGPVRRLNERLAEAPRSLSVSPDDDARTASRINDYLLRYQRFRPWERYFQDITFSPDFPTVAAVAAKVAPQAGLGEIDGVMAVDPYGLAALLEFTGPVKLEGLDTTLKSDNAAEFLLTGQYYETVTRTERQEVLEEAGRAAFEKLVKGSLPSPKKLADTLAPVVEAHHLVATTFGPGEEDFFALIGLTGSFPSPAGHDLFSLRMQNSANNKIDPYLHRRIEYRATVDPGTGTVEATATITLRNDAPAQGVPAPIIVSQDDKFPPGTNASYLSVYTPFGLRKARLDGEEIGMEFHRELGSSVYSRYIELGPGQSLTLELELFGSVAKGKQYTLVVPRQPLVNRDDLVVYIRPDHGWQVEEVAIRGFETPLAVLSSEMYAAGAPGADAEIKVKFSRG
ncbi:MAG: DUF4012 domain-containing protein [Acidimicrobiales bacterium]|nr:DUF4012 domain-containing protein [Acidimicrobiales bacterium]